MIKSMEIDAQAELGWGTIRANSIVDNMLLRIACFDELFDNLPGLRPPIFLRD